MGAEVHGLREAFITQFTRVGLLCCVGCHVAAQTAQLDKETTTIYDDF